MSTSTTAAQPAMFAGTRKLVPGFMLCAVIAVAGAEYMHRHIPNSRKVVIDDAGHAANMDQPHAFNAAVRELLEQL